LGGGDKIARGEMIRVPNVRAEVSRRVKAVRYPLIDKFGNL
jgi:hypothetical protein